MKTKEYLKELMETRKLNRRDFLTAAAAVGVSAAAAGTMFTEAKAAMMKKGGRLRQALTGGGTGDVLDPAQTLDSYMINVSFGQLRNNLTEIAADGSLVGELAESWEASPDAKTWTFKLRKGVEFHNGKTMDANDVVASLNHHRGEGSKSAAKGLVKQITDIKADGDNVVISLSGGNADFSYLVSDYHLTICPAGDGGIDWKSGIGTGGYALDSFEPGVRTLAKRNPNYWKSDRAYFDEIETLYVADVNARQSALKTGEIDVMSNPDLKTVNLLGRSGDITVFKTTGNKQATLPMFTDVKPFDNNHVRMALKLALDREQWLKVIFKNFGVLGNDHPIGPANQYQAKNLPQRAYDPDKAKWHLKQAGMENLTVPFSAADTAFEGAVDAAQLFQETAKAAGITLNVTREPNDGYWSNVWLKKPWVACYWGGRPTEDWIFSQIYQKGADWNDTHWDHAKFNELLIQARAELDEEKRRAMYEEMQLLVRDEGGVIVPAFLSYVHAASTKVNLPDQMANNWELDGHKNGERWSFT